MTGEPRARPPHLQVGGIALVFAGGFAGTVLRAWLQETVPTATAVLLQGVPLTTLAINVVGSFLLGWLVVAWARRTRLRLLLGTGLLGGFTTYSALSADTVELLGAGRVGAAALYGVGTVVLGLVAAAAGMAVAGKATAGVAPGSVAPGIDESAS